jgi:hypothetical protein
VVALKSVELSKPQKELLKGALAAKLEAMGADYRAFAMTFQTLTSEVESLGDFTAAIGDYAVMQARAPRCAPDFALKITGDNDAEIRPSKVESGFNPQPYFQSGDARRMVDGLTTLRNFPPGNRLGGWSNQLADFLRDFAAWDPPGDDIDAFHQRATIFRALLEITPRGEDHDRVLALCVAFLGSSAAERDHPAEWLYQVKMLVEGPGFDAAKTLELFRASGSAGLALYAMTLPGT